MRQQSSIHLYINMYCTRVLSTTTAALLVCLTCSAGFESQTREAVLCTRKQGTLIFVEVFDTIVHSFDAGGAVSWGGASF